MPRVVTATEAKNRLGALMQEVTASNQPVLIELRGQPNAALISASELDRYKELDRRARIAEAMRLLDEIRTEAAILNADLSPEEADELALRAVREVRTEQSARQRNVADEEPVWHIDDSVN